MIRMRRTVLAALLALIPSIASANWESVRDLVKQADGMNDKEKRIVVLRRAYAAAQASVKRAPKISNEYLWLANAAGRLAQAAPMKERIELAGVVKTNAERAIALDGTNGAAHMTLGAWHFYVADISWVERNAAKAVYGELPSASYATAVDHLSKALKYGVENPVEVLFIRGRAYDALDKEKLAMADFRACVAGKARNAMEQKIQAKAKEKLE